MLIVTAIYFDVQVRNEKARRYLTSMRKKQPVLFAQKFPNADPLALRLLQRLLAFDPKDRPTAEEVGHIILKYPSSLCFRLSACQCYCFGKSCEWTFDINVLNLGFGVFTRHWLILISRDCQKLRGNLRASQLQRWSLNLRGEGSQRRIYGS